MSAREAQRAAKLRAGKQIFEEVLRLKWRRDRTLSVTAQQLREVIADQARRGRRVRGGKAR